MNKQISLVLALSIAGQPLVVAVQPARVPSIYHQIMPELLAPPAGEPAEDADLFSATGAADEMDPAEKRYIVFNLFGRASKSNIIKPAYPQFDTHHIRKDLEIFTQTDANLFRKLCKTKTIFGEAVFAKMLAQPTPDRAELQRRQSIIQALVDSPELFTLVEQSLESIKTIEPLFLSFFSEQNELRQQLLADLYFNRAMWSHFDVNTSAWDKSPKMLLGSELASKSLIFFSLLFLKWRWEMVQREAGTPFLVTIMGAYTLMMLKPKWFMKASPIVPPAGFCYGVYQLHHAWDKAGSRDGARLQAEIEAAAYYAPPQEQANILNQIPPLQRALDQAERVSKAQFAQLPWYGKAWSVLNNAFRSAYEKFTIVELVLNTPVQMFQSWHEIKGWHGKYRHLQAKFKRLQQAVTLLHTINDTFAQHPKLLEHIVEIQPMIRSLELEEGISKDMKNLLAILQHDTFKGPFTIMSHFGRITAANSLMLSCRRDWVEIFESIGHLDTYLSVARLIKQNAISKAPFCMVTYEERTTPHIALTDFWNPFVDPEKVVTNSLELGNGARHMILTGPNTGGKSTVLKALAINVLLAQTFGIAAARSCTLAPFSAIITNIRIEDNIERGVSLFMAESERAKLLKNTISALKPDQFGLVIIDEMFRGTAPDQAALLAHLYAKDELGVFPNCMLLEATHYPEMIKLEAETNGLFVNYRVAIERNPDGSLRRTYQLQRGSTTQNVAADILREQGFAIKTGTA